MSSQSAGSDSAAGPMRISPALLTTMSSRPNSVTTCCTAVSACARSATSATNAAAVPPDALMRSLRTSRRSPRRAINATVAPAPARAVAVASPMPLLAPVTNATALLRGCSMIPSCVTGSAETRYGRATSGSQQGDSMQMRAARMYGYNEPLRLEEIDVPQIGPDEVLVKVAATGMCRSDCQLMEGYFPITASFPITPGHEVAGHIAEVGSGVPGAAGLSEGDLVVVNPNWGDGTCRQCREGSEQICGNGQMAGFGPPGGFAEYMPVTYRHVIKVPAGLDPKPETLAPLTDAGLTPY